MCMVAFQLLHAETLHMYILLIIVWLIKDVLVCLCNKMNSSGYLYVHNVVTTYFL